MFTTLKRLQERDASEWRIEERFSYYQNRLTDIIEKASRESVEYARQFENPVIVMEDLTYIRESLDYGKYMNRRLHSWAFARLQGRIEDKAKDAGIPVRYVYLNTPRRRAICARTSVIDLGKPSSSARTPSVTYRRSKQTSTRVRTSHVA